ncbi:Rapamycin-insensitive companion of mTOR, middle domain-containing protein [Phakopsora pachyrhizi]|nr:Rapamycin-insensitive companion of mTOR, middle domain-containing protein [Phakopsora pachyrhizi]
MIDWNQQQQQLQQQQHPLTSISSSSNLNQLGSHQVMVPQSSSSPDQSQMSAGGSNNHSRDSVKEQLQSLRSKLDRAEAIQRGAENLLHQVGAGQGLKRKDNYHHDSHSTSSNQGNAGLQASVEAELDLANRNQVTELGINVISHHHPHPEEKRQAEIEIRTLIDQLSVELSDKNLRRLSNLIKSASKSLKGLGHSKIQETTLTRDNRFEYEKLQALVFTRSIIIDNHPRNGSLLTVGIIRAIVSIAETIEERLRSLSIETLGELMIRDFELLVESDGLKVIIQSLTDHQSGSTGNLIDLSTYLTSFIMAMIDRPKFRRFLKPGVDFEMALAAITEANGPTSSQAQEERLILLDALFEIFQVKTSTWYGTFMSGRRLTYYQKPGQQFNFSNPPPNTGKDLPTEKVLDRASLIDHYLAILLLVFFDVKLLEVLIEMTETTTTKDIPEARTTLQRPNSFKDQSSKSIEVKKKASLLIAEILDLSSRVLPLHYGTRIQSLPRLFELAASFQKREHRATGTTALREVDSLHRTKQRLATPLLPSRGRSGSNSSYWEEISLYRSFGIAPATLSSVAGGGTVTSGGGIMSGVVSVETSSKGGGTGGIGSSGSVSGLTSSLSLITGTSSTSEKNSGGTGSGGANSLSVGGGNSTNSAISGSESTPTSRLLHYSDPRSRLNLINIDDLSFRTLVIETQVLVTKDHTRWNIEKLLELIEGSLYMNPKRLEELTRSTKVMKRLLAFLHPFEGRYPYIKRTKHTSKYTKLACSTLRTLLSDQVGVKFLSEDKLVEQIGTALRQLDPHSGVSQSETLFTQTRVEDTLTHGYFEMLGVLTKSPDGIKNGHCRLVLSKALTSSYKHVRLFATHHLEKLISNSEFGTTGPSSFFAQSSLNLINGSSTSLGTSNMSSGIIGTAINLATNLSPSVGNSSSSSNNYNSFISNSSNSTSPLSNTKIWLIRLLLTQLYDPSPEVCGLAVEILEEACTASIEVLETVVQMRPSLENLGDVGVPLLLKFLSTPFGAKYLNEIEWTEREMDEWYNERSRDYVIQLETHLSKSLNADGTKDEEDEELIASADGTPPPHFYGELVKTHEGRKLLNSKGHLKDYVETIKRHGYETFDLNKLSNLKTALWAIGNIGSIALTPEGAELLSDLGWESVLTPLGIHRGICVPRDLDKFIVNPSWNPKKKKMKDLYHYHGPSSGESKLYKQITNSIANLSNHLLANNSSRTLSRLRTKYRETFQDLSLFYRAMKILANYHYRFLTRRFVMELFGEIKLDEEVVRKIGSIEESIKLKIRSSSSNSNSNDKVEDFNLKNNDSRKAQGFRANDDGDDNEIESESETEVEIDIEDLPIRSGAGLLEAYDKTDYRSSDEDEEEEEEEDYGDESDVKKRSNSTVIIRIQKVKS